MPNSYRNSYRNLFPFIAPVFPDLHGSPGNDAGSACHVGGRCGRLRQPRRRRWPHPSSASGTASRSGHAATATTATKCNLLQRSRGYHWLIRRWRLGAQAQTKAATATTPGDQPSTGKVFFTRIFFGNLARKKTYFECVCLFLKLTIVMFCVMSSGCPNSLFLWEGHRAVSYTHLTLPTIYSV